MKNIIKSVDCDSPLTGKVSAGDSLRTINENIIHDVLDYKYFAYDRRLSVCFERPDGSEYTVKVRKGEGGELGLDFETYLMDVPRSCANNCVFCFIDQLPPGMRKSMYFKDDDARLSFLMGNYITLTNLSQREIQRIIDLRISPVNVSVHTMHPELRCMMMGNRNAGKSIEVMERFAAAGIVMNCQIVCCPGLNDGDELSRSMRELEALYPAVHSVSIVPVGLTKYREGLYELEGFTPELAAETIDMVSMFAAGCLERHGTRLFFCSDELYILAGRQLPPDDYYEEHTQLENGVGMIRLLEAEFMSALKLADRIDGVPFSIATGVAAAPYIQKLIDEAKKLWPGLDGRVYAIENDYFGHSVNVAGLITGRDIINQLKGRYLGERMLISQNMLRRDEMDFLDDVTLSELSESLGVPVYPVEQDGFALWDAVAGDLPVIPEPKTGEDYDYCKYNQN